MSGQLIGEDLLSTAAALVNDPRDCWRIFRAEVNIVVWRRTVAPQLERFVEETLLPRDVKRVVVCDSNAPDFAGLLQGIPQAEGHAAFRADLRLLVDFYATLMGPGTINLKLESFGSNLCERFHADRVGLRLLCSYAGPGTEWLANQDIDRTKLGPGSGGLPDEESGLLRPGAVVQQLNRFDVTLMKGEHWPGNSGKGLVHRSPRVVGSGQRRVLFKIDS